MSAEDTDSNAQIIHPARDVLILLGNRTCQLWKLERGRGWHADKGTGDNAHSKGHENSFDDAGVTAGPGVLSKRSSTRLGGTGLD